MSSLASFADNLELGLRTAFSLSNLLYCFIGVFLGTFIGVLPGIGTLTAVSLLLPVTFHVDPTSAIVMLAGVFYGSHYGGSTASILLNLPGTPATAVTCLDGYPMSQQGRAGVALFMTTIASFVGGCIGIVLMMLFAPVIAEFALHFGPAEYFSIMVLGLVAASTISIGSPIKGFAMVVLGILLGLVGADVETGVARYSFGILYLENGISLVVVAMGLFGVAEVIASIRSAQRGPVDRKSITFRSMIPTRDDLRLSWPAIWRGSGIGSFFGTLPGTGGVIASFASYAVEKRMAKDPSRFGRGAIEGIVGPEAANNAADQTAFIPTMTLGIPGNVIMALMMGALTIHGIIPGPTLMIEQPSLFWGLIMSFWVGNVLLVFLNIPLIGLWMRVLAVPFHVLYPCVLLCVCIGVYTIHNSYFDVVLVTMFGAAGYLMRLLGLQPAPLLLGLVLGPLMEENLRRAMLISRGDYVVFFERPLSATFIGVTAALLIWAFLGAARDSLRPAAQKS